MSTYISILRGINVSGQKKILMADLKLLFEGLGYNNIQTYIQSGNVVFKSDATNSNDALALQIKEKILSKYKFDVPVQVYSDTEWVDTVNGNPFLGSDQIDITKLHVTFLGKDPLAVDIDKFGSGDYGEEHFKLLGRAMYVYCPNGYGRAKLNNNFIERKLNVQATTRNWKTVNILAEMTQIN